MGEAAGKLGASGKKLSYRGLFWRIWIAASLGWLLLIGVGTVSTVIRHQDLSTEAARLEAERGRSMRGSSRASDATTRLRRNAYEMDEAENDMIRGGALMVAPPVAILILASFASLFLASERDAG